MSPQNTRSSCPTPSTSGTRFPNTRSAVVIAWRSIGRRLQADTMTTGWWGLISFFTNFGAVAGNAASLRRRAALPSATPRPVNAPGPGRTVFLRPLTYVAPLAIAGVAIDAAVQPDAPGWHTGSCVSVTGKTAVPAACSSTSDGKITSVVAASGACPRSSHGSVVIGDKRYCVS